MDIIFAISTKGSQYLWIVYPNNVLKLLENNLSYFKIIFLEKYCEHVIKEFSVLTFIIIGFFFVVNYKLNFLLVFLLADLHEQIKNVI